MSNRSEKLVALREMMDLETGKYDESFFEWENQLCKKAIEMKGLNRVIRNCQKCPGMNITRLTENCPGWGDLNAKVFFIGQSLHVPGVKSGLPFILGSGYLMDMALRLSGLLRKDVFISNVVHCHPEGNRGSMEEEKQNCFSFLAIEIEIVQPRMIVAMGNDAKEFLDNMLRKGFKIPKTVRTLKVKHPASFLHSANPEQMYNWVVKLSMEIDKVYK